MHWALLKKQIYEWPTHTWKKWTLSLVIRGMQIKATMKYHSTTIWIARTWINQKELSYIVGRVQNGTSTLEIYLAISYKTKHTPTLQSSNSTPRNSSKRNKSICSPKGLHLNIPNSFTHNSQNLETATCPINKMAKQTMVY